MHWVAGSGVCPADISGGCPQAHRALPVTVLESGDEEQGHLLLGRPHPCLPSTLGWHAPDGPGPQLALGPPHAQGPCSLGGASLGRAAPKRVSGGQKALEAPALGAWGPGMATALGVEGGVEEQRLQGVCGLTSGPQRQGRAALPGAAACACPPGPAPGTWHTPGEGREGKSAMWLLPGREAWSWPAQGWPCHRAACADGQT